MRAMLLAGFALAVASLVSAQPSGEADSVTEFDTFNYEGTP